MSYLDCPALAMTTTLPSFVELMATLGLENASGLPSLDMAATSGSTNSRFNHSRSSSASSCSSFSSSLSGPLSPPRPTIHLGGSPAADREDSPSDRDWEMERRRARAARFSPYAPSISHMRKRSTPASIRPEMEDVPTRSLSTSPYLSPTCNISRRSSHTLLRNSSVHLRKVALSESDLTITTPISTFVRRKTPQASPTSPMFSHRPRKRSCSPVQPVSIPTLPHVFPLSKSWNYGSSDTEDEDMHDAVN